MTERLEGKRGLPAGIRPGTDSCPPFWCPEWYLVCGLFQQQHYWWCPTASHHPPLSFQFDTHFTFQRYSRSIPMFSSQKCKDGRQLDSMHFPRRCTLAGKHMPGHVMVVDAWSSDCCPCTWTIMWFLHLVFNIEAISAPLCSSRLGVHLSSTFSAFCNP